jgi:hypothetical protein
LIVVVGLWVVVVVVVVLVCSRCVLIDAKKVEVVSCFVFALSNNGSAMISSPSSTVNISRETNNENNKRNKKRRWKIH